MLLDVLARRVVQAGDRTFLVHRGQRVSYAGLDRVSNRVANGLRARGVVKGDRVTLALGNSIEYVATAFGVLKAGAILHPINPQLGVGELEYVLTHAAPRVLVTEADHAAKFAGFPSALATDLVATPQDGPPGVVIAEGDGSTLLYTSGTTGRPKGVLFTHGRTGTSGPHFIERLGLVSSDVILSVTPLFHGNAWGSVVTAVHAGCAAAFPVTFRGSEFWELVHETGATVLYTLGTVLAMLLTRDPAPLERNNPLRIILGLGSASIRDRVIERFGVEDVLECFGSTDAGVVTITPRGAAPRAGSCGPAAPGVAIRILDGEGRPCPAGQPGEIAVCSPARMAAYFRDPEETARAVRDDWFLTGDLGYLDVDGWLYFVDRKRDVIRRGGENVSSAWVEKTLREHPAVADAAVIGVPDPVLGQEIKAYVVPKEPIDAEALRAFCAERLAKFQVPRLWEFRDALPKTPTQRVEKYKLRAEHDGGKPLLG